MSYEWNIKSKDGNENKNAVDNSVNEETMDRGEWNSDRGGSKDKSRLKSYASVVKESVTKYPRLASKGHSLTVSSASAVKDTRTATILQGEPRSVGKSPLPTVSYASASTTLQGEPRSVDRSTHLL